SFAVILGMMTLMAGVAYVQMSHIVKEAASIQTEAMPGLYSSMRIDSALHQQHLLIQRLVASDVSEDVLKTDLARLRESFVELNEMTHTYEAAALGASERALYAEFARV